jgi:hypothetical protein
MKQLFVAVLLCSQSAFAMDYYCTFKGVCDSILWLQTDSATGTIIIGDDMLVGGFKNYWKLEAFKNETRLQATIPFERCSSNVCLSVDMDENKDLTIELFDNVREGKEPYFKASYSCKPL